MPVPQTLVHGRWAGFTSRALRHRVTILTATESRDPNGAIVKAWSDQLPACVDEPCVLSMPIRGIRGRSGKTRQADLVETVIRRECFIARYIPEITEEMRAMVDGVKYEIEFIERDSQRNATFLEVRQVL